MKRLLTLHLRTRGCAAEAALNGVALARVNASGATALPVHEFLLRGANRLALRVDPASLDHLDEAEPANAAVELRLAGTDTSSDTGTDSRVLARANWTMQTPVGAHAGIGVDIDLPIDFPRWRWLDAPPLLAGLQDALRARALQCVRERVLELRRGAADGWFALTRLAIEERALAYGGDARTARAAFLDHLRAAPDGHPWSWAWIADDDFVLRSDADGRLLSCLRRAGGPALQACSRDGRHAWSLPLRLTWIDERLHGLR
jgi:hypothetical protein